MKTDAAIEQDRIAWLLTTEGFNASELALALEMTRQSALCLIRRIRQNQLARSPSTAPDACPSTVGGLRMRQGILEMEAR